MSRTASLDKTVVDPSFSRTKSGSSSFTPKGRGFLQDFLQDVVAGLSETPKQLQPKYFYDQRGSELFDQICGLREYYPFESELELLPRVAKELRTILTRDYAMVEFGAGSLRKVKPLLNEIAGIHSFTPIDISGEHLRHACADLQKEYPDLLVHPVEADFCEAVELTDSPHCPLGFFPGSTIGNFSPAQARSFLVNAGQTLGRDSYMLIGVDTKKSPEILHAAYNDSRGVTASFNRNILERINHELNGNFDPDSFEHYAFYNPAKGRVEMHLVSGADQQIRIAGRVFRFRAGESIHTENSYKYTPVEFAQLAHSAGWKLQAQWLSAGDLFATYLIRYGD